MKIFAIAFCIITFSLVMSALSNTGLMATGYPEQGISDKIDQLPDEISPADFVSTQAPNTIGVGIEVIFDAVSWSWVDAYIPIEYEVGFLLWKVVFAGISVMLTFFALIDIFLKRGDTV